VDVDGGATLRATTHARLVLTDCEESLLELRAAQQETLRRRWLATMALLRAVGHVLHKVDGSKSSELRTAIDRKYSELRQTQPEPAIFWQFIELERNNLLKEYRFAVRGDLTIAMPGGEQEGLRSRVPGWPAGATGMVVEPPMPGTAPFGTRFTTSRFTISPFGDGPFLGRDPVEVVQEAIAFWKRYLDEIDGALDE